MDNRKDWIRVDTYWMNVHKQGSKGWESARVNGFDGRKLITASKFAAAAGWDNFKCKNDLVKEMATGSSSFPTEISAKHMKRGVKYEPVARMMYEDITKTKVKEVGLIVSDLDHRIGASLDGMVGDDGCIEIKCPETVYWRLTQYDRRRYPLRENIFPSHYAQMQGGMAITGRSWCDYVVLGVSDCEIVITRVPFDSDYWNLELYPKLVSFVTELDTFPTSN